LRRSAKEIYSVDFDSIEKHIDDERTLAIPHKDYYHGGLCQILDFMPEAIKKVHKLDWRLLAAAGSMYSVYHYHYLAVVNPPMYFGSIGFSAVFTLFTLSYKRWLREQATLMWVLPGGTHLRILFMNSEMRDVPVAELQIREISKLHLLLEFKDKERMRKVFVKMNWEAQGGQLKDKLDLDILMALGHPSVHKV